MHMHVSQGNNYFKSSNIHIYFFTSGNVARFTGFFFLERAGELRINILRRKGGKKEPPVHKTTN